MKFWKHIHKKRETPERRRKTDAGQRRFSIADFSIACAKWVKKASIAAAKSIKKTNISTAKWIKKASVAVAKWIKKTSISTAKWIKKASVAVAKWVKKASVTVAKWVKRASVSVAKWIKKASIAAAKWIRKTVLSALSRLKKTVPAAASRIKHAAIAAVKRTVAFFTHRDKRFWVTAACIAFICVACIVLIIVLPAAARPVIVVTADPTPAVETPAPNPTLTPEPTPKPTPTPEPTPSGLCGGRFDVFTDGEVVITEDSYQTDTIALFYSTEVTDKDGKFNQQFIHRIDIYVQEIVDLRSYLWYPDKKDWRLRLPQLAEKSNAIAAISGDFYHNRKYGLSVRNSDVIRGTVDPEYDIFILYRDGTVATMGIGEYDATVVEDRNIWQLLSFGPILLDATGQPRKEFPVLQKSSPTLDSGHYGARNQRMVFGYFEPGHYIWVLVEAGNGRSSGLRMDELAELMKDYGCRIAYNLDGGQTAQMWFLGELRNQLGYGGRSRFLQDILLVPFFVENRDDFIPGIIRVLDG